MDKSWIDIGDRTTKAYLQGVNSFLVFALRNSLVGNKIRCPCRKCVNSFWKEPTEVREHLICDGFLKGYRTWNLHGEASSSFVDNGKGDISEFIEESSEDDNMSELIKDMEVDRPLEPQPPNEDVAAIHKLAAENSQALYPGCNKYSTLCFLVRLLNIKNLGGWTDISFDLLLDLLADVLPKGSALPKNYHEAKELVKSVGVGHTSIHACENDCVHEEFNSCPKANFCIGYQKRRV